MDAAPVHPDEVELVARGIATAVAPEGGLTDVQAALLQAIAEALTGVHVDYRHLDPISPAELATALAGRDDEYRQRIVHHMVLGELVLRPLPAEVAQRVGTFAEALGVHDRFVPLARRYADAAFDLAWMDLQRSGFRSTVAQGERDAPDPFAVPVPDPELEARWSAFRDLPEGTLGRRVARMYDGRGFALPGSPKGAAAYLSQHDFVHVLADYGTDLKGELEVFAFIGRADPDPKGFAWLATFVGLFETGYIEQAGFFQRDVQEQNISAPGMGVRIADAIRRGKEVCLRYGTDLFDVDYFALADMTVDDVRGLLNIVPKSPEAVAAGSAGVFDRDGMSDTQRAFADAHPLP